MMVSKAVKWIEQPRGGYLNPHAMQVSELNTDDYLYPSENESITGGEMGTTVDYLTRYILTGDIEKAFSISLKGAKIADMSDQAEHLLNSIHGIDKVSVDAAIHLVAFDVYIRNPVSALMGGWNPPTLITDETVSNVQTMVKRCLKLFDEYGKCLDCYLVFPGAYTKNIDSGDADFMTKDTIWDFKVSQKDISVRDTFQLLIYYLLSQHSDLDKYGSINKIGTYNPRLNRLHLISVEEIDIRILKYLNKYIIGYDDENASFNDFIQALDERPNYPRYNRKPGTEKLLEQLVLLECTDLEKIRLLRTSRNEYVRMRLGRYIEDEEIRSFMEAFKKLCELKRYYHDFFRPIYFMKGMKPL